MTQAALHARPAYVHLSGYSLIEPENAGRIVSLLEQLKADGSKIFFDPSPLCKEIDRQVLSKVLALADVFCPNKVEKQIIEEYLNLKEEITAPDSLNGGRLVVVKDGSHGATAFDRKWSSNSSRFPGGNRGWYRRRR